MRNITKENCTNTSTKRTKRIKITALVIVGYVLLVNCSIFCLAQEGTHIIGDDPVKTDLRRFDGEWLIDEFDDTNWDDLDEGLNDVYNGLYSHWDDRKANELLYDNTGENYYNPDCLKKYLDNDFADVTQLLVTDLDEDVAKMVVRVNGDADSANKPWFLFVWSDCVGSDSDDLVMFGVFVPGDDDIGGEDYSFYEWDQGNSNGNGTLDFDNAGHDIEMEFDAENWENVKLCNIRAIMLTTANEEYELLEEEDMIIDIFPGVESANQLTWLWILLIIIIAIVAVILIYLIIRRKKRNKSGRRKEKKIKL